MTRIFVIAGHGAGDPGCCGGGYSEAERVRALAQAIKKHGGSSVTLGDFRRNYYADNGISSLDLPKDTQIVELHMDGAVPSAHGGHVIIQAGIGGPDKYDRALAKLVCGMFPGRSVQIVERDDLANPARAAARGYGYRLVENGFISNDGDRRIFNANIDKLAIGYCEAFGIKTRGGDVTPKQHAGEAKNSAGIKYHAHCANVGDLPTVRDGQVAGTVGFGTRLEAVVIDAVPQGWEIEAQAHIQGIGWKTYKGIKSNVKCLIGSRGEKRRIEALGFRVTKRPVGDERKLYFQVHQAAYGWKAKTREGYFSGSDGESLQLEAVKLWIE